MLKEEIQKKIDLGTLEEVSSKELEEILAKAYHFFYLSMIRSKNSESTQERMINKTYTSVPSVGISFCLENKVPTSKIGDSHDSLMDFRLYQSWGGYSSDIRKCYLCV